MSSAASSSVLALVLALGGVSPAQSADVPDSGEAGTGLPAGDPTPSGAADTGDAADSGSGTGEVRALSGTSVIGNKEVPKSLYIVPWKNSEVGLSTDLSRDLLDGGIGPVDPNEFERRIQFHQNNQQ